MPKLGHVKPVNATCKACAGTGKNSKGGLCAPCVQTGKIKPPVAKGR